MTVIICTRGDLTLCEYGEPISYEKTRDADDVEVIHVPGIRICTKKVVYINGIVCSDGEVK